MHEDIYGTACKVEAATINAVLGTSTYCHGHGLKSTDCVNDAIIFENLNIGLRFTNSKCWGGGFRLYQIDTNGVDHGSGINACNNVYKSIFNNMLVPDSPPPSPAPAPPAPASPPSIPNYMMELTGCPESHEVLADIHLTISDTSLTQDEVIEQIRDSIHSNINNNTAVSISKHNIVVSTSVQSGINRPPVPPRPSPPVPFPPSPPLCSCSQIVISGVTEIDQPIPLVEPGDPAYPTSTTTGRMDDNPLGGSAVYSYVDAHGRRIGLYYRSSSSGLPFYHIKRTGGGSFGYASQVMSSKAEDPNTGDVLCPQDSQVTYSSHSCTGCSTFTITGPVTVSCGQPPSPPPAGI